MQDNANPLLKHFRQPQLYIKLPSEGNFYPKGSIDIPVTKEFPVYAMTAKDELTIKTPDALLNGQATVDVIQSCIPSIKDAWHVPSIDLDHILIAIRRATYGDGMDFTSVCPHCENKNEHTLNLQALATGKVSHEEFNQTVKCQSLEFYLKPLAYRDINNLNLEQYENQRLMAVVRDSSLDEADRVKKFNEMFNKILDSTVSQISGSVAAIKTAEGVLVDNAKFIDEFFRNCDRTVWDAVKAAIERLGDKNPLTKIELVCEGDDCNKPYNTPLIFDTSSFFA